ncbi:MAG: PAS domain S-box protein [Rhodospirillaceae bacterium]|nr:PAS domain S-box protein [Rhodospirillales bacterium]
MTMLSTTKGHHVRDDSLTGGWGASMLENVLAAAVDWVWETDADQKLVRLSSRFAEDTGISPDHVIGRSLDELLLRFLVDETDLNQQARVLAAHAPFRNLHLHLWDAVGDRMRHFQLSGLPWHEAGRFAGYRGIGQEVTVPVDRDVRESDNRFRTIFEHAALGIAVVRPGGRLIQANQALQAMFGYPAGDLLRLGFTELTHVDDRADDEAAARRLVTGEVDSYCRENRYLRRDGSTFWGRLTASVVPGEFEDRFTVVMIEDIDDRKRAEANLSLFRKVMDAAHEAVTILSPSGHILYANSAYKRLFGLQPGTVCGSHYRNYFPPSSQAVIDRTVGPALLRGESWEGIMDAVDPSGRVFPLWQRAGVLRDEGGRVQFFFAFMHDNTDRQLFEDELFDAKEAAEEANVAKTRFLAAASHDLRQPMQALSMFVAVLAGRSMDLAQAALVTRIQDSVTALEGLLNSLLDVSKLEAGLIEPHIAQFPVAGMMDRLAAEFEPLCEAAGLELKVVPSRRVVRSDSSLLERILRNLLNNAVRYTKTGRILFGCRRRGRELVFEVWDTGIGIPQAEMKNIFREFHQVGNSGRDRRQGLGLGLAIVERLAALMDHSITVKSREGRGSVFAVSVHATEQAPVHAKPRQLQLGLARKGAAILVVEDEPDVRESLELLLESWGHLVLSAASAEDALNRLSLWGRMPELVIADYRLENGDTGGEAIARIEGQLCPTCKLPAIILTGDTAPERLQQAKALGHGLLHKPVQAPLLQSAIDEALARGARAHRRAARGAGKADMRKAKAS